MDPRLSTLSLRVKAAKKFTAPTEPHRLGWSSASLKPKKKLRKFDLTTTQIEAIFEFMDRTKWTRQQVADHFGVKSSCVSYLLRQRKKNTALVEEHDEKQRSRKSRLKAVMKHATNAMVSKTGLIRAKDV